MSLPRESEGTREARSALVAKLRARGIVDTRVLAAIAAVPRHELVPADERADAYEDAPLPIGEHQTISQPYIVALMTQAARVGPGAKVLEVGVGSGYQSAVLAELGACVFSVEVIPSLAQRARRDLDRLGVGGVTIRVGDGFEGWPEEAPFDAIVVTAAAPRVPPPLLAQLADGGRMVVPVGEADGEQWLEVHEREGAMTSVSRLCRVRFVPMTGLAQGGPAPGHKPLG